MQTAVIDVCIGECFTNVLIFGAGVVVGWLIGYGMEWLLGAHK